MGEEIDPAKLDGGKRTTTAGGQSGGAGTGGTGNGGSGGTGTGGSGGSVTGGTGGNATGGTGGSGGSATGGSGGGVTGGRGGGGTGGSATGGTGGSGTGGSGGSGGGPRDGGMDSAGRGGAGATGGSGGTGGTTSDASTAGLHVLYAALKAQSSSAYVQCELHAKNNGSTPAPISELKLRYYFTDEVKKTPQIMINWSHVCAPGNCSHSLMVTSSIVPNVPPAASADMYIEFGFSSSRPALGPGESADFTFQMQGPNPATDVYTQTNDYSFDSSKTDLSAWPNIVLLQNGNVAWGTPP